MLDYQKKSDTLVCMDSDGTVMDTMTLKHEKCFGPSFLTVFKITSHCEEILKYWLDINLYLPSRGINRFVGLDCAINYIRQFGYEYSGYADYHAWVSTTKEYSIASINQAMENKNKTTFLLALEWSKLVNEKITNLPPSKPFHGVVEGIVNASKTCDLLGVSSANPQAVYEEWTRLNLMPYFQAVACQDKGNKESILKQAKEKGYSRIIMLGDAMGDLEASIASGCYFFPIIPTKEVESWERFSKEALPKFVNNLFTEEYQKELIDEFISFLKGGKKDETDL